jgi:hypothetical protein
MTRSSQSNDLNFYTKICFFCTCSIFHKLLCTYNYSEPFKERVKQVVQKLKFYYKNKQLEN